MSSKISISRVFKRGLDVVGGLIGMLILIPTIVILYLVYKVKKIDTSLFFVQERIGRNGKMFKMYKFQTMVNNADKVLEELLEKDEEARIEYAKYKKLKEDPRITKIGALLRKTSIDELPQFINILKGDMSLVGPRPYLNREKEDMKDSYHTIIKLKPGLTGLWQVSGRSDITFEERIDLDHTYFHECNFIHDIKILFKTVILVIKREGAE